MFKTSNLSIDNRHKVWYTYYSSKGIIKKLE